MQIKRYTIDGYIRFVDDKPRITAEFFFDREKDYDEFELTAKIIYKDGTIKKVPLEANCVIDDGLGNPTYACEVDQEEDEFGSGGKGLKKSVFEYQLSEGEERTISKIYINGEYTGSTAYKYAGAYVGSGEGVLVNMGVGL